MADLFSPLIIGKRALHNRIVAAPLLAEPSHTEGFVRDVLIETYATWARGGAGLVLSELFSVVPPADNTPDDQLGLYHDAFVPDLRRLVTRVRAAGSCLLIGLDAPPVAPDADMRVTVEAFVTAIWRAHHAGADGILLSTANDGILHHLLSPLLNRRSDAYGHDLAGRQQLTITIVEEARRWFGDRLILGVRLLPDDFTAGGLSLQDARIFARRLTAAGVRLIEVAAPEASPNVARFPGWAVPLASGIRRITDVPVIGSGELDDPSLADSLVRDRSIDLVMPGHAPQHGPSWPAFALATLDLI